MDVFIARQPIFNTQKQVIAYELLFRSSLENFYDDSVHADRATTKVVSDSLLVIGLNTMTKGKPAFINFTRNLLLRGAPSVISKDLVYVEVLETVEPDDLVISACRELKQDGYTIVLDDFVFHERFRPLIDLADIIKVDFQDTPPPERKKIIESCNSGSISFLAEKVETDEEFQEALNLGYKYFQGYFFSKPCIIARKDIPGNKLNNFKILQEVNRPETDMDKIEEIVKHDISLSFKLLKFINSAFFNFRIQVESIKHALVLLGADELKKWITLIAMTGIGSDKPPELLTFSLVRARFCEHLAPLTGMQNRNADLFLMGMFSMIDALIDRPMEEIIEELPLSYDVTAALLGKPNPLTDVFNIVLAYEKGNWDSTCRLAQKLNISEDDLPEFFFNSVEWANVAF
ncbi:MAG: HDOD domain-containing protein [Deltaproteobacteria bacterium]|nr:HDOD domain-containing protein [Deltaproteobacteria bacterium]